QGQEHLVDRVVDVGGQVLHMDHGQLVGEALPLGPGVLGALGDDALVVVGDDGHVLASGKPAQGRHHGGGQHLLPQDPAAGGAANNGPAVVGQDGSGPAGLAQAQLPGHGQDPRRGAAGSQHDGDPPGQGGIQGGPGAGGDLLLVVGEGAVQIQGQHLDILIRHRKRFSFSLVVPFGSFSFYCTIK